MPQPKSIISNYSIRQQGDFYIFSNEFKDLFYYSPLMKEHFYPQQISVDVYYFDDRYLDYIFTKLYLNYIPADKIEFYLNLYFTRLIKYPDFEKFHISDTLLNRNGRFDPYLFKFYESYYFGIERNIPNYLMPGKSYSKEHSGLVFNYMETKTTKDVLEAECNVISRIDFEAQLNNFELQYSYVEYYYDTNQFYQLPIVEDSIYSGHFSYCYLMFNENNLVMFYFI